MTVACVVKTVAMKGENLRRYNPPEAVIHSWKCAAMRSVRLQKLLV